MLFFSLYLPLHPLPLFGLIASVVWPLLLLSLVMSLSLPFWRLLLGALPLSSLLSIYVIYSFLRVMVSRWVRLLVGLVLVILGLRFTFGLGANALGVTLASLRFVCFILQCHMLAVGPGSRRPLSPLGHCVYGDKFHLSAPI